MKETHYYAPAEERFNIISHGIGFLLSIVALPLLIIRASQYENPWLMVSFIVFGLSLILLYLASTLYHSAKEDKLRNRLNIFDHAAIYVLIAGTYTPFSLVTLPSNIGWIIFGTIWGFALAGVILKLFFTGKYNILSTVMYVFMGWIIIFAVKPLIANLPVEGLLWMLAGGIAYTIGAVLYSIKRLHFNHAIFHIFVLMGSFCHFMAVYLFVVPK